MKLKKEIYTVEKDTTVTTETNFICMKNEKKITYLKKIQQSVYIFCLVLLVLLTIVQVISINESLSKYNPEAFVKFIVLSRVHILLQNT